MCLCVCVPCVLVMAAFQWQALSFGPKGLKHTHVHTHTLSLYLNQQDNGARASSSIKHMVYTGSQGGIEVLFIEALACGKQGSIVRQPGILSFSSIRPSAITHTQLNRIFPFRPIWDASLRQCTIVLLFKILKSCKDISKCCFFTILYD